MIDFALYYDVDEGIEGAPDQADLRNWIAAVLIACPPEGGQSLEMCVRLCHEATSAEFNQHYRNRPNATNVLSFPLDPPPPEVPLRPLGDLLICAPVVQREAQHMPDGDTAHWAHMVIHGVLHLLGYDHQNDAEATEMEALESRLLVALGYPDPYCEDAHERPK